MPFPVVHPTSYFCYHVDHPSPSSLAQSICLDLYQAIFQHNLVVNHHICIPPQSSKRDFPSSREMLPSIPPIQLIHLVKPIHRVKPIHHIKLRNLIHILTFTCQVGSHQLTQLAIHIPDINSCNSVSFLERKIYKSQALQAH